jgi:hypothetical protein
VVEELSDEKKLLYGHEYGVFRSFFPTRSENVIRRFGLALSAYENQSVLMKLTLSRLQRFEQNNPL